MIGIPGNPLLNMVGPVNWLSPLNRGLQFWGLCVPGLVGGSRLMNLCRLGDKDGNHGTLTNGPTFGSAAGRPGGFGSLSFDGTDDYVAITPTTSFGGGGQALTVSAWIYPITSGENNYGRIVNNGEVSPWCLLMDIDVTGVQWTVGGTATNSGTITYSAWTHVVGTYNGAAVTMYWNGVQKSTASKTGNMPADSATVWIGNNSATSRSFAGRIDSVKVYPNRAFTAAEVWHLYNEERLGCPQTLNRLPMRAYGNLAAPATSGLLLRRRRMAA